MLSTIEDNSKLETKMHFGESGKSTFKLCVGIASIILEGRQIGENSLSSEHKEAIGKDRESTDLLYGFLRRGDDKGFGNSVNGLNTASKIEYEKNLNLLGSPRCDLFDVFPSTSTSTPKKLNLDSFIDFDWEDDDYDGFRGEELTSSRIPKYRSFQSKLDRIEIRKSSSSSSVHTALQSAKPNKQQGIKQGPHCESFLKKMTMLKDNSNDVEHICSLSNISCQRWRYNIQTFSAILSRNEIPCIEVFAGSEQNALLLEVWTFKLNKSSMASGLMTIQSLCCAIRSQMYFSQLSSWIDLLNKSENKNDVDANKIANLDIFFRIKAYEGIDLFKEKPIIHNFPETKLSDLLTINISLKSLPRLEKIPIFNNQSSLKCDYIDLSSSSIRNNLQLIDNTGHRLNESLMGLRHRRESFSGKIKNFMSTSSSTSISQQPKKSENQNQFSEFSEQAINDVFPPLYQPISDNMENSKESTSFDCEDQSINKFDDSDVFNTSNETSTSTLSNCDNKSSSLLSSINEYQNISNNISRMDSSSSCSSCFSPMVNKFLPTDSSCDIAESADYISDKIKIDCRQCKRRKVRHNGNFFKGKSNRRTMSECLVGNYPSEETETFETAGNYEFPICDKTMSARIEENILNFHELNAYRRAFSDDVINQTEDYPEKQQNYSARISENEKLLNSFPTEINNNFTLEHNNDVTKSTIVSSKTACYKKFIRKSGLELKRPHLLGSFEESLLQDRFQAKSIVNGFRALMGAAGSFCPSQLTLPAQTKFYEFNKSSGNMMSTPYVCEFRLPRKGYSIPRTGQLNVTLLNPQGMVVRMFFITYDLRDMPTMSQTFIRQRMLATDEHVIQKDIDKISCSEQMKYLRYSIHLRFQTSKSGRLSLHKDVKIIVSRKSEQDTAQAHARNSQESFDLKTITVMPEPKYSSRIVKD